MRCRRRWCTAWGAPRSSWRERRARAGFVAPAAFIITLDARRGSSALRTLERPASNTIAPHEGIRRLPTSSIPVAYEARRLARRGFLARPVEMRVGTPPPWRLARPIPKKEVQGRHRIVGCSTRRGTEGHLEIRARDQHLVRASMLPRSPGQPRQHLARMSDA